MQMNPDRNRELMMISKARFLYLVAIIIIPNIYLATQTL